MYFVFFAFQMFSRLARQWFLSTWLRLGGFPDAEGQGNEYLDLDSLTHQLFVCFYCLFVLCFFDCFIVFFFGVFF